MNGGYVKIARGIFKHTMFKNEPFTEREVWIWLICGGSYKDDAIRNGASVWHSDGTYIPDSTTITMLHAKKVPVNGGETLIADLANLSFLLVAPYVAYSFFLQNSPLSSSS